MSKKWRITSPTGMVLLLIVNNQSEFQVNVFSINNVKGLYDDAASDNNRAMTISTFSTETAELKMGTGQHTAILRTRSLTGLQ